MNDLKPCPFCKSGWLYETQKNDYYDETAVMFCNSCKAIVTLEQVEEEGVNEKTRKFVRERWNTRAERTCHITAFGLPLSDFPIGKGSNCGCGADVSSKYCWQCGAKVVEQ